VNCQPPPPLHYAPASADRRFPFSISPPELIAQQPAARRDASRLLFCTGIQVKPSIGSFPDLLEFLKPGNVLVLI
jgi:S-adenosylmethionine:tRNA ribosyltransferase-isomerase